MNLTISGRHVRSRPAIRSYVESKLSRIRRHFDHVIDVNVILTSDGLAQKAEVTCHVAGKDIYVESDDPDLYAASTLCRTSSTPDHQIQRPPACASHDALKHRSPRINPSVRIPRLSGPPGHGFCVRRVAEIGRFCHSPR